MTQTTTSRFAWIGFGVALLTVFIGVLQLKTNDSLPLLEYESEIASFLAETAKKNQTIVTAESVTAGYIVSSLVAVPGYGRYIYGGFVTYDTEAKRKMLEVMVEDVYTPECAFEMAKQALENSDASLSISVTGRAAPAPSTDLLGAVDIGVGQRMSNGTVTVALHKISCATIDTNQRIMWNKHIAEICRKYVQEATPTNLVSPATLTLAREALRKHTALEAIAFASRVLSKQM